jgi:hypothetical protein
MTGGDHSRQADGGGQAIRRLPTGLYELSPTLPPPQPTLRAHQPAGWGAALFGVAHRWKNVGLLAASTMIGIAGFVTLSIERQGGDSVTEPAVPTQVANLSSPIVDVASVPPRSQAPEARPNPLPVTTAMADAYVQAPLGARSPDNTGSASERRADGPVVNAEAFGSSEAAVSELRSAPTGHIKAEKRKPQAHHAARRGTIKSARRKTHDRSFWDMFFPPLSFRY